MVLPRPLSLPPPPPPLAAAPWARSMPPSAMQPPAPPAFDWVDHDHSFAAQPPVDYRQIAASVPASVAKAAHFAQTPLLHAQPSLAHLHGSQRSLAQLAHVHTSQPVFAQSPQHNLTQLLPPNQAASPPATAQQLASTPLPPQPHAARAAHEQNAPPASQPLNLQQQQQLAPPYHAHQIQQQQQQQRLNVQRQHGRHIQQPPQTQLGLPQSRPLRPRLSPAPNPSSQQAVHMPPLPQTLFSQSAPDVSDLASAALGARAALLQGPGPAPAPADVLSVPNDPSQIGLSFATPPSGAQLESYAQLPGANADFWHTVIDQNKQRQAAAAAAAALKAQQQQQQGASAPESFKQPQLPLSTSNPQQLFNNTSSPRPSSGSTAAVGSSSRSPAAAAPQASRAQKQMLACDLCGRVFGQRGSLGRHKKAVHMGVRPFPCQTCGFCFQQRYDLRKHILSVHEHERPYACDFKGCKAAFSRRAKLRKHVTTVHLKQRDFVCEICNSAFGEKSNKTKHIRAVHLQERKYACSMCHAAFKERGHRTKHMLTQHNVQANADGSAAAVAVNRALPKPPVS